MKGITERYNDSEYLKKNPTWGAEDSPWKAQHIVSILEKNGLLPETVAEVGCGAGEIILKLSERYKSSKFVGFELSQNAFDICKPKKTDRVDFKLQDIAVLDQQFDLLLCIDVFEHVENYIEFVRDLKPRAKHHIFHIPLDLSVSSVLRGSMMISREVVGHLHYFTPETALATLRDAGYVIEDYFLTAPFAGDGLPSKTFGAKIMKLPRRALYALSPSLLSRVFGGCTLLVLTS